MRSVSSRLAAGTPPAPCIPTARNITHANDLALESSPITAALWALMEKRLIWTGTATDLLGELDDLGKDREIQSPGWPKDAARLAGKLRRVAPNLRKTGLAVEF